MQLKRVILNVIYSYFYFSSAQVVFTSALGVIDMHVSNMQPFKFTHGTSQHHFGNCLAQFERW